jgi:hypothetical protein
VRLPSFGRLADDRLLLGRSGTDEIADNHEPGRDPDSHLQGRTGVRCEFRNHLNKIEPGANCALGIMFMRLRIAEIDEHPIAHLLGHEPVEPGDRLRDALNDTR